MLQLPNFAPLAFVPPRPERCVRILALSDWRTQDWGAVLRFLDTGPGVDVILYGGDDLDRLLNPSNLVSELASRCTTKRILFVAGNDDSPEDRDRLAASPWAHNLDREPFLLEGLAICGLEASTDGLGLIQHTERRVTTRLTRHLATITQQAKRRSPRRLILVSHAPPKRILDSAIRFSENGLARSIGSSNLRKFLDGNQVLLTICGHVHLCGGQQHQLSNGNIVLNIASHDNPRSEGRLALIDVRPRRKPSILRFSTNELQEKDELLLLHQVGSARAECLRSRGIVSLQSITNENRERLRVPGVADWHIDRWIRQAALLRSGRATFEVIDHEQMRFLSGHHFVTWDIETDLAQKRIWLIGAHDTQTGETVQFFDPDDEAKCVGRFLEWMAQRPSAVPLSYSGTRLETRALRVVMARHGLIDPCGIVQRDIDLCERLQNRCVHSFGVPFRLKELAVALGFHFRHTDLDGMQVGMAFEEYLRSRCPPDWHRLLEYNEDDVMATTHICARVQAMCSTPAKGGQERDARHRDHPLT